MEFREFKFEIEYMVREIEVEEIDRTEIEITSGFFQGLRFFFKKFDAREAEFEITFDYSISHVPSGMQGEPSRYEHIVKSILEDYLSKELVVAQEDK